jgi:uncharacterized membrane protein
MNKNIPMDLVSLIYGLIMLGVALFVPGYSLTLALFPKKKEIDDLERFTLSFAFSIAVVPLVLVFENFLGVPINSISVITNVILITLIGLLFFFKQDKAAFERVKEGDFEALLLREPKKRGKK